MTEVLTMRPIDADKIQWKSYPNDYGETNDDYVEKCDIDNMPTVDAVPVVHGRWLKRRNGGTLCNRCGHYTQYKGQVLDMSEAIACPWCGAMMDGGAE